MLCFREIIDAWPSAAALAVDLGEESVTVRAWRARDVLPGRVWRKAVAAAERRRIRGVSLERLALLAEQKAAA